MAISGRVHKSAPEDRQSRFAVGCHILLTDGQVGHVIIQGYQPATSSTPNTWQRNNLMIKQIRYIELQTLSKIAMSDVVALDWRCVSQHYIQELIAKAVDQHQLDLKFKPSLIVAAGEDALSVARMLRACLKGKLPGSSILTLSSSLDLYDEEANPYNPSHGYWGNNS